MFKFKCHFWWHVQHLVKFKCYFSWQAQYLVKFKCHSLRQAVQGEVEVSLFVADALREVQVLLFVAVGGEVLLRTTNYYSSTTKYYSSITLYYKVLLRYYKVLLRYYFETSFTMRGTTGITLTPHQILRLPPKMNVIRYPRHI